MPVHSSNGEMKKSKPKTSTKKNANIEDELFKFKQAISFLLEELQDVRKDVNKVLSRMGL